MELFKKFSLALALALTLNVAAFANDQEEASDEIAEATAAKGKSKIVSTTNPAQLTRTDASPRKFKISMPIEFEKTVCKQMGTRIVFGPDYSCGTYVDYQYSCGAPYGYGRRYGSYDPYGHPGGYYGPGYYAGGRYYPGDYYGPGYGSGCGYYPVVRPLSCDHPVAACVQTAVEKYTDTRSVNVVFKKNADLAAGETETFEVLGKAVRVDSRNATFELKQISTKATYATKDGVNFWTGVDKIVVSK